MIATDGTAAVAAPRRLERPPLPVIVAPTAKDPALTRSLIRSSTAAAGDPHSFPWLIERGSPRTAHLSWTAGDRSPGRQAPVKLHLFGREHSDRPGGSATDPIARRCGAPAPLPVAGFSLLALRMRR